MKTFTRLIVVMASALVIVLSGCQSAPSASDKTASESTAPYYDIKDTDTKPVPRDTRAAPRYPIEMKRRGISGEAVISFVVMTDGRTDQVKAVRVSHDVFGGAAVEAVKQWSFKPATKDGKPVNCRMTIPIVFNLSR